MRVRLLAASLLLVASCTDGNISPPSPPASYNRHIRGLTTDDQARLTALRAPFGWIADFHHQAMQEVLRDPNIAQYTGRGLDSPACAAQIRYMKLYAARIKDFLVAPRGTSPDTSLDVDALARTVGVCVAVRGATAAPTTVVTRYAATLATDLRAANSLAAALETIDQLLVDALHDPDVSPEQLSSIAAVTVIAISSVNEWYTLAVGNSAKRSAGFEAHALEWSFGVTTDDANGCAQGSATTMGCAVGAIGGSIFSWL